MRWYNVPGITTESLIRDYPLFFNVQWEIINGFYDGPLNGEVTVSGETRRLYASVMEEIDTDGDDNGGGERIYAVLELDDATWAREDEKNADFERYVGSHWRRGHNLTEVKPVETHHLFYDKWPWQENGTPKGRVVGWFKE